MNSEQQKERQTAVARIDKTLRDMADAWEVEIDARLKSEEHIKELMASIVDGEAQYRKRAIQTSGDDLRKLIFAVEQSLHGFVVMSWWKRLGWVFLGPRIMLWFLKTPAVETPVQVAEAMNKKQRSYTERPQ